MSMRTARPASQKQQPGGPSSDVARTLFDVLGHVLGRPPEFAIAAWDGSRAGPPDAATTVTIKNPIALRRLLWQPNELGMARAYIAGDLDVEGDLIGALEQTVSSATPASQSSRLGVTEKLGVLSAAAKMGAIGTPPKPPSGEVKLHGRLHSRRRDAAAVSHHYDVGNDFYRLLLDETMTYSCGYWTADPSPTFTLADAQRAKYELICRKLGLRRGMRLLDVGCGWGGMVMHAAQNHGVNALGVTVSRAQESLARQRIHDAGLDDQIEIRYCDYRELRSDHSERFDAISSIGMAEHVGAAAFAEYAGTLFQLMTPTGRLLNHQISMPDGASRAKSGPTFINRYIFPDGELQPVGNVVGALERAGFEVRDVESLRENYVLTLLAWLENLRANRAEAVELVGDERVRTWELYIAGSAAAFNTGHIGIHQTLAIKPDDGRSGLPRIRTQWLCD
jgi:cyclopropane-fatty-acyl-phospholipid synthase